MSADVHGETIAGVEALLIGRSRARANMFGPSSHGMLTAFRL